MNAKFHKFVITHSIFGINAIIIIIIIILGLKHDNVIHISEESQVR